jgi:hypothetical protein
MITQVGISTFLLVGSLSSTLPSTVTSASECVMAQATEGVVTGKPTPGPSVDYQNALPAPMPTVPLETLKGNKTVPWTDLLPQPAAAPPAPNGQQPGYIIKEGSVGSGITSHERLVPEDKF